MVYRVIAHRSAEEPYTAMVSSTFVWRSGTSQLAFRQQTPT